jgi:hypothetical protein
LGSSFPLFTFNLMVNETVPNSASGLFVGTSAAGTVFSDSNPLAIVWAPLQLGPDTGAWTGNFGPAIFKTTNPTQIVAPNSNTGTTSVQGLLTAVPEPMTFGLIGAGLIGLGLLRRRTRKS